MPEQIDDETKNLIVTLRVKDGKTMRQIATETGVSVGKVGEICRGVPAAKEMDEGTRPRVEYVPVMVSKENSAKIYALALSEGYDSADKWLQERLLPWWTVLKDFEWKLRQTLVPSDFAVWLEKTMVDSIELAQLKAHLNSIAAKNQPQSDDRVIAPQAGSRTGMVNNS